MMGQEVGARWGKDEEIQIKDHSKISSLRNGRMFGAIKKSTIPQGILQNEKVSGEKMMISPFEVLAVHEGRGSIKYLTCQTLLKQ